MTRPIATVKDLHRALTHIPAATNLHVRAGGADLTPGFHLTEVAVAAYDSIDCGGRRLSWMEASLEVMDSGLGRPMQIGTLRGILGKATDALPDLAELELGVDVDPGGDGLRRYTIGGLDHDAEAGVLSLSLTPRHATCKPVVEAAQRGASDCRAVGCCA